MRRRFTPRFEAMGAIAPPSGDAFQLGALAPPEEALLVNPGATDSPHCELSDVVGDVVAGVVVNLVGGIVTAVTGSSTIGDVVASVL